MQTSSSTSFLSLLLKDYSSILSGRDTSQTTSTMVQTSQMPVFTVPALDSPETTISCASLLPTGSLDEDFFNFAFQMLGTPCKQHICLSECFPQCCLPLQSHLMIQRQPFFLSPSPLIQNMSNRSAHVQDASDTLEMAYTTKRTPQTHLFVITTLSNPKTTTLPPYSLLLHPQPPDCSSDILDDRPSL
jgi:hypothetical protein